MPLLRLSGPQRAAIRDALLAAFPTPAHMTELLQALDRSFVQLTVSDANFHANALAVVNNADAEGWLLSLIAKAHELRRQDLTIAQWLTELTPLMPPADLDLWAVCRLSGGYVMVDRDPLRDSLRELDRAQGKRLLVVNGAAGTGKSHSMQLIAYVAEVRRHFTFVPLDLEAYQRMLGTDAIIDPYDLGERLAALLRYEFVLKERPAGKQWANWVLRFCDDFEACAREDQRLVWVVIDAFNNVVLTQATLDLIKELANRVGLSLPRFRLVFLGYGDLLPEGLGPQLEVETIGPIGPAEVFTFFAKAHAQMHIPCAQDGLLTLSHRVLTGLDSVDPAFLRTLGARASEELAKVASGDGTS